jgi:cell division protein FtsL
LQKGEKMKKMVYVLLVVMWVPLFGLISPDLQSLMTRTNSSDLVPIDIVLKKQMDVNELTRMVKHLSKPERRARTAQILQNFSQENQAQILAFLRKMEAKNQVRNIQSLWILNAIYCEATPEVIQHLSKDQSIFYVDYDLKPIEVEKPGQTVAPEDKTSKTR